MKLKYTFTKTLILIISGPCLYFCSMFSDIYIFVFIKCAEQTDFLLLLTFDQMYTFSFSINYFSLHRMVDKFTYPLEKGNNFEGKYS